MGNTYPKEQSNPLTDNKERPNTIRVKFSEMNPVNALGIGCKCLNNECHCVKINFHVEEKLDVKPINLSEVIKPQKGGDKESEYDKVFDKLGLSNDVIMSGGTEELST